MADIEKLKAHMASEKRKNEVRDKMKELIDLTNCMSADKDVAVGIFEGLLSCHRTLQQSFFRSFVMAMGPYGDTEWCDARNQASVDFAKKISEMDDIYFPFV